MWWKSRLPAQSPLPIGSLKSGQVMKQGPVLQTEIIAEAIAVRPSTPRHEVPPKLEQREDVSVLGGVFT